jgi:hypothetical protein
MNQHSASQIAISFLDRTLERWSGKLAIIDSRTIETEHSWVFCWQSRTWVETRDYRDELAGTFPVIIDKADGSACFMKLDRSLGSVTFKEQLQAMEAQRLYRRTKPSDVA